MEFALVEFALVGPCQGVGGYAAGDPLAPCTARPMLRRPSVWLLLLPLPLAFGCRSAPSEGSAAQVEMPAAVAAPWPRSATLVAQDFLRSSLSLNDGGAGSMLQDGRVLNRDSQIEYGNYVQQAFSVGIQGGEIGRILDLGPWEQLARLHGYSEVVGGGVGFLSICREGQGLQVLGAAGHPSTQPLRGTQALFALDARDLDSIEPEVGHIYLLRILDRHDSSYELLVKLLVTEHRPGESVSFLWQPL